MDKIYELIRGSDECRATLIKFGAKLSVESGFGVLR